MSQYLSAFHFVFSIYTFKYLNFFYHFSIIRFGRFLFTFKRSPFLLLLFFAKSSCGVIHMMLSLLLPNIRLFSLAYKFLILLIYPLLSFFSFFLSRFIPDSSSIIYLPRYTLLACQGFALVRTTWQWSWLEIRCKQLWSVNHSVKTIHCHHHIH